MVLWTVVHIGIRSHQLAGLGWRPRCGLGRHHLDCVTREAGRRWACANRFLQQALGRKQGE